MKAILTENLTKYYGKSRGIIDVNLSVDEGDFFGFIGPNAAGKSTTIRTLLGLISPTSGGGKILGKDIVREHCEVLTQIGYLPSETLFYSGMKVKDMIKLSADLRGLNCEKESKALCDRLQLDTTKKVEELSFGNRKKVGIVCALQHMPKLLILDEPTSGLDPLMQKEFFDILHERNKEGTTIFISSHILSEIQKNCKNAAIIREGKIIACDSVDVLAKTNAKRITIHGDIREEFFVNVRDKKYVEGGVNFLYSGDMNVFIKQISDMNIIDLTITEPDLEEIFMHYYSNGGER